MDRRRLLRLAASAGAAGLAGFAGCTGGGDDAGGRTVNPGLRGTPTDSPTPSPSPTPYGAGAADALAVPRDLVVGNQRLAEATAVVRVTEDDRTVAERRLRVPGASHRRASRLFGAERTYDVYVDVGDGRSASFAWKATATGGHLGVDLTGDVRRFDHYGPTRALNLVTGSTGGLVGGDGVTTLFVFDNPGPARSVSFAVGGGGGSAGVDVLVPARSRVLLPLSVPRSTERVAATVGGATDTFRWQPLADRRLFVRVGEPPRFLCDLLTRDLRVRNDRPSTTSVQVLVDADGRRALADSLTLDPGEEATRRAAVPPASSLTFEVTVEGETERVDWTECPPIGPVVVRVSEDGVAVTAPPSEPNA